MGRPGSSILAPASLRDAGAAGPGGAITWSPHVHDVGSVARHGDVALEQVEGQQTDNWRLVTLSQSRILTGLFAVDLKKTSKISQ